MARFPELRWLDRHHYLPGVVLAVALFLAGGWPALVWGFFVSTVICWHGTFTINSLSHVYGRRRYPTTDTSRNNFWLALITLGEGWHNNHHAHMASTRQGFRWWEIDVTYYILKALSWVGLVWDLTEPPRELVRNERRLGRGVVEKVARHLAATASIDRISEQVREAIGNTPKWDELRARARTAQADAAEYLASIELPSLPTIDELRERALQMIPATPSMDDIVERAREMILEAVAVELVATPA